MTLARNLFVALAGLSLSACASLLGNGDGTWISSDPGFVECELAGDGFHKVVQTPKEVVLPKGAAPIRIACRASGYRAVAHSIRPEINPMVAANFVFGSSLGAVIDVMNGAALKYPARLKVHMEPESFASEAERDAWYERYRHAVEARWNKVISDLEIVCADEHETPLDCVDELKRARGDASHQLQILENRRQLAAIRGPVRTQLSAN